MCSYDLFCARYSIATFDKLDAAAFGIEAWAGTPEDFNARASAVRARMRALGCGKPLQ